MSDILIYYHITHMFSVQALNSLLYSVRNTSTIFAFYTYWADVSGTIAATGVYLDRYFMDGIMII